MAGYMILHDRVTDPGQMGEYIQKVLPTMEHYKDVLPPRLESTEGFAVICESFAFPPA